MSRPLAPFLALLLAVTAVPGAGTARAVVVPDGPYDPHRVLVSFRPGTSTEARGAAHRTVGARLENTLAWRGLEVLALPKGLGPTEAAVRYRQNPNVAYAHPNWLVYEAASTPNDTFFPEEFGLHNTGQTRTVTNTQSPPLVPSLRSGTPDADIDAPEGWGAAFGAGAFPNAGGIRVGVLDTGIDAAHPDIAGKVKACAKAVSGNGAVTVGECADDRSHGTHVAATVGANTNDGTGVAGVAPNVEIAAFKALGSTGSGTFADVIAGLHWLHTAGAARIVNMSLGGPQDAAWSQELSEAAASGALLIASAGNNGDATLNYPAAHPDVVSVAATDASDRHASFSNCNADVEVAAPGVDVLSAIPGGHWAVKSGTSMAAPHASGVAAMIMWRYGLGAAGTRARLSGTVDDLGTAGRDTCFGHGRVNLARAMGVDVPQPPPPPPPPPPGPGHIQGFVTDLQTGLGIVAATVDCGSGGRGITGPAGAYLIPQVPAGTHNCTASAALYKPRSKAVTVFTGAIHSLDFQLRQAR